MSVGFGGAVKLTGESEYRKALRNITQSLREVDSELKVVTSQYDKNDKSQEALSAQADALAKKYELQAKKVETLEANYQSMSEKADENRSRHEALRSELEGAVEELQKIEKESGKTSTEYQTQARYISALTEDYNRSQTAIDGQEVALSKLKTELNNATASMNSTKNELDSLNSEMQEGGKEATELGGKMENAGKEAGDSSEGFTVMKAVVADLASTAIKEAIKGLAELAGAVVEAGKALAQTSLDAGKLADSINTLSMQSGVSTDTIQELNYASELLDVSTDTVTGSMTRLLRSMSSAQDGTGDTAAAFEQMGISITDASGELRDNEDVFWDVIDYLGTLENESERDALAMSVLGRSAQDLNPLIIQGSDAFRQLAEEAHETGYVMDSEALGAFQGLDDNMQRLNNGATAAKNAIGSILLPALTNLSSQGVSLLNTFTTAMNDTNGDLSQIGSVFSAVLPQVTELLISIGEEVSGLLSELVPQLIEQIPPLLNSALPLLVSGVNSLLKGVLSVIPQIIPTIASVIPQIASTLLGLIPQLLGVGVQVILELARGIAQALPSLLRQLPTIISETVQTLISLLPEIIETGFLLLTSLIQGLTEAMPELVAMLPTVIETLVDTLLDPAMLNMIINSGIELITALIEGIVESLPLLVEMTPRVTMAFINAIIESLPGVLQVGKDLLNKFIEGAQLVFGTLRAKCGEIFNIVHDKLAELPTALITIGKNLVEGLWNGISSMTDWVISKIQGFSDSVLQGIRDFFGIASPSKVFAELGGYMAQGLGVGFSDEMQNVTDQMRNSIPTSFDVNGDSSSVGSVGGGLDYYTLVNALREALTGVTVEMDDVTLGRFVRQTVSNAIYT